MDHYAVAADKLYRYLVTHHGDGGALVGPDPGIRFNYRVGRFIKGYLGFVPWNDQLYYLQGQAYWILANWVLHERTGDKSHAQMAVDCADQILARQRPDGAWDYPNPEWAGRVATVEGTWASIGLIETYRRTGKQHLLDGALRWHSYLHREIGFQRIGDEVAVNYFARRKDARVPNNSTLYLYLLGALWATTEDRRYLDETPGLVTFLERAQLSMGELPYSVDGVAGTRGRTHFQCYQYNAFECLDLIQYHTLTGDDRVLPIIRQVLRFLSAGIRPDGHAAYACNSVQRRVSYHTGALAAAFTEAQRVGIYDYTDLARRAYAYLISLQRPDGGFIHSQRDYGVLRDVRSYPRYLAMILYHLLIAEALTEDTTGKEAAYDTVR